MNTAIEIYTAFLCLVAVSCLGEPVTFPADSGVVNVREYGARGDGVTDDTAAIQRALDSYPNGSRIIYLPAGNYRISDTLKWPKGSHSGHSYKRTILQGQGEHLTLIRLRDNCPGYEQSGQDGKANLKAVVWTGGAPAQRFRNAVRDLTISTGSRNPGASGLQFNASNQGCVRNVTIRSEDRDGRVGLDLGHTDEIGPLLVKNVTVIGFEEGIRTWWPVNSCTFEHIRLMDQTRYGWHNYHQMIFVRDLVSSNSVPALYNRKDSWGSVTLTDSALFGVDAADQRGIFNQRQLYVRNTRVEGYDKAIDNSDKGRDKGDITGPGLIREDTSHANVASLFRNDIAESGVLPPDGAGLFLPVKETPKIPWGDPSREWTNVVAFGADPTGVTNSVAALQAAVDSGCPTVYLPGGCRFRFEGEVELRGPLARIIGLEGRFDGSPEQPLVLRLVDGSHPRGLPDAPAVILERYQASNLEIHHESERTLVVSSCIGGYVRGLGRGDLFVEDACVRLNLETSGQNVWCRQLNTENTGTMLLNNGANLWILGMKTEKIGTIIHTANGGRTEALGIFIYSNQGWDKTIPAFVIEDSSVFLAGVNERNFNRRPVSLWMRETQDGVTKEMKTPFRVYVGK